MSKVRRRRARTPWTDPMWGRRDRKKIERGERVVSHHRFAKAIETWKPHLRPPSPGRLVTLARRIVFTLRWGVFRWLRY